MAMTVMVAIAAEEFVVEYPAVTFELFLSGFFFCVMLAMLSFVFCPAKANHAAYKAVKKLAGQDAQLAIYFKVNSMVHTFHDLDEGITVSGAKVPSPGSFFPSTKSSTLNGKYYLDERKITLLDRKLWGVKDSTRWGGRVDLKSSGLEKVYRQFGGTGRLVLPANERTWYLVDESELSKLEGKEMMPISPSKQISSRWPEMKAKLSDTAEGYVCHSKTQRVERTPPTKDWEPARRGSGCVPPTVHVPEKHWGAARLQGLFLGGGMLDTHFNRQRSILARWNEWTEFSAQRSPRAMH